MNARSPRRIATVAAILLLGLAGVIAFLTVGPSQSGGAAVGSGPANTSEVYADGYMTPAALAQGIVDYQHELAPTYGIQNVECRYTTKKGSTPTRYRCKAAYTPHEQPWLPQDTYQHNDIVVTGKADGTVSCKDNSPGDEHGGEYDPLCPKDSLEQTPSEPDAGAQAVSRACGVSPDSLYLSVPADPAHGSNDSLYTSNDGSGHSYQLNYYSGRVVCH